MQKMTLAQAKQTQGGMVFVPVALSFVAGYTAGSIGSGIGRKFLARRLK